MKTKFYQIGFFVLLAIIILASISLLLTLNSKKNFSSAEEQQVEDTSRANIRNPQNEYYSRLSDSVQMVKDSIDLVVAFMQDSINLQGLPKDQQIAYGVSYNTLARIKLQMDFRLENERLQQLKIESDTLQSLITKFDKKKEQLNILSNKLERLTAFVKTAIGALAFGVSNGIIIEPSKT